MNRSIRAALGVAIVALAIPAAALATHTHASGLHHRGHGHLRFGATGSTGAAGSNSVTTYSGGTLVLALASGGSITGAVTDGTRFVCAGQGFGRHGGRGFGPFRSRLKDHRHFGSTGSSGATGWSGYTGSTGDHGSNGTGSTGRHGWDGNTGATGKSGWTQQPPCDSSLLTQGALVSYADVLVTPSGVQFATIVLLPAVQ